jgi:membrane fusion protein, multidrug efflux system
VAAAAIGLVLFGAAGHEAPSAGAAAQAAAMPVPVASVVRQTVPVYLDYIGRTEAIRTVTLQAQVTGYLATRGARMARMSSKVSCSTRLTHGITRPCSAR